MAGLVSGRSSIHRDNDRESPRRRHFKVQEPMETCDNVEQTVELEVDEEYSQSKSENNTRNESGWNEMDEAENEPSASYNCTWCWIIYAGLFGACVIISYSCDNNADKCKEVMNHNMEIVDNLRVGIDECKQFHKPSVLLFLYRKMDESAVDELIANVSNYASCNLSGAKTDAINVPLSELQSREVKEDYGLIIEKYRKDLEERSVMVVRGLERVPGVAAQAFHSLCDEVSPVVKNAMFVFTMRVSSYEPGISDFKLVETTLKRNWNDLQVDIFEPLLARITSMIVRLE